MPTGSTRLLAGLGEKNWYGFPVTLQEMVLIMILQKIVRKIDYRIMLWAFIMFFSLDLDRINISQANTDNFLKDLHMTTDDFNLGNTLFKVHVQLLVVRIFV